MFLDLLTIELKGDSPKPKEDHEMDIPFNSECHRPGTNQQETRPRVFTMPLGRSWGIWLKSLLEDEGKDAGCEDGG